VRYRDYVHLFSTDSEENVVLHRPTDHTINLEPDFNLPDGRIYNLLEVELETLKDYIDTNLAIGFIQQPSLPGAAPILIANKTDGGLRLCVDY
jgi:hypothetical protein